MIIYKCWTKLKGGDDETILINSKWCLGQLKLKTVQFPHSAHVAKAKFNPVNKYKSQEHTISRKSHQSVFSRDESSSLPRLQSSSRRRTGLDEQRNFVDSLLLFLHEYTAVIGTAARPNRYTSLEWPVDHRPNQWVLSTSLALARGIHIHLRLRETNSNSVQFYCW